MHKIATLILSTALALSLSACNKADKADTGKKTNEFYYSNPTGKAISFKLDEKSYILQAGTSGKMMLLPGQHVLENSNGHRFPFMVFDDNDGGILNPNHYMYYMLSTAYLKDGENSDHHASSTEFPLVINGHLLKMPLPVMTTNAVLIDGKVFNCNYPLATPFPAELMLGNKENAVKLERKCFDKPEVISYLASVYHLDVATVLPNSPYQDVVNKKLNYVIPEPHFRDGPLQQQAEKLNALAKQIVKSHDPAIRDKLKEPLSAIALEMSAAHMKASKQLASHYADQVAQEKAINDYNRQIYQVIDAGILPQ